MSGFRHNAFERRGRLADGDVSAAVLIRDIEAGSRYFWSSRVQQSSTAYLPGFTTRAPKSTLAECAAALVAMGKPPRGTMSRMAVANGLNYSSLATKVYELRGGQKCRGGRAA